MGYLAIGVLLILFAMGFVSMAQRILNAGAAYAYVTAGLGRVMGGAAAGIAVTACNAMQVAFYGGFGVAASHAAATVTGVEWPWWVWALAAWGTVACLGLARVDVSSTVLAVLLGAEMLVIIVYSIAFITSPGPGGVQTATLDPTHLASPGAGAVLVIAFAGFVGLEGSSVFMEEARDPRTIARSTYLGIGLIAATYGLATWALSVATGSAHIVDAAAEHGTQLMFVLAAQRLPTELVGAGLLLFATSVYAGILAWHNVAARYHFALGREGVLPRRLGVVSARTRAPKNGSVAQSVIGVAAIVLTAGLGGDPTTHLFFAGSTSAAFGVLMLMTLTSVAVFFYFARQPGHRPSVSRTYAPAMAAIGLGVVALLTVAEFHRLLGVEPDAAVAWMLPSVYLLVALAGAAWALYLRHAKPQVWNRIGRGAHPTPARHDTPSASVSTQ